MQIRFIHQALIGTRVHAVGDVLSLPEREAKALIDRGVAEPAPEAEPIREATSRVVQEARRATKRGNREARSSDSPR